MNRAYENGDMEYVYLHAPMFFNEEKTCKAIGLEGYENKNRRIMMAESLAKRAIGEEIIV